MDGGEAFPSETQGERLERLDTAGNMEGTAAPAASASDENENRLDGKASEPAATGDGVAGTPATVTEDSINNNERQGSPSSAKSVHEEPQQNTDAENVSSSNQRDCESARGKGKGGPGKRSSRSKKGFDTKSTGVSSVDTAMPTQESKSSDPVQEESTLEAKANCQPRDQKQLLQSLLSLIGEEIEKTDTRILPHCLHQVAETYFQEEEYEKAIQFIHLEQLYHEQLLANLSAIQEKWETKWKTVMPDKTPSPRPSDKGLNNEELERLQHICTSHQEPAVRKRKLTSDEKFLKCKDFMDLRESEELRGSAATSCSSDGDTHLGTDPRRAKQQANVKMTESSPRSGKVDNLTEAASPGVAAGKAHMEEQRPCAESIREGDTQFTEAVGRPCSDCLCAGDARKADHCLQPGATQPGEDGAEVTRAISAEPKEDDPEEPMVDRLLLTDLEHAVPDLNAKGVLRAEGNCDDSVAAAESQLGNIVLGLLQPPGLGDGKEGGSVQGGTDASTCSTAPDENTVKTTENTRALPSSICREETHEEMQNEATEDFFIYLLNGSLKDSGDLLTNLEQSDFDTQTDEEASYSPGESALEDSPVSLDELAKRIEVEEIIPAEGLVSILKKRNDGEEKNVVEIQQKQTKRRVRFQEMDDALDQDEVAGGSCLLLILLCVVTVFISVGGTALYCSFGDMESPVCTDFASNMDLYYTQVLQGLEEVKHWVFPS